MVGLLRLLCLLLIGLPLTAAQSEGEVWIEHFDKASGKPFFYNSVTRESAWEAPEGASVQRLAPEGSSADGSRNGGSSGNVGLVTLAVLLPIGLPIIGLGICYYMASKEGLADLLKEMRAKDRNRAAKRRGQKAGGSYRQRQKLSQDGKGGRSANS